MAFCVRTHALLFFPREFALCYNPVLRTRGSNLPSLAAVHEVNPAGRPMDFQLRRTGCLER